MENNTFLEGKNCCAPDSFCNPADDVAGTSGFVRRR